MYLAVMEVRDLSHLSQVDVINYIVIKIHST
jgi:hypothetical protein